MFDKIFNDVGGVIKTLAKIVLVTFWIGAAIAWIILLTRLSSYLAWLPWVVLVGGVFSGWLFGILIYSWGIVVQSHDFS